MARLLSYDRWSFDQSDWHLYCVQSMTLQSWWSYHSTAVAPTICYPTSILLLPSKRIWLTLILHQALSYHLLLSNHVAGHIFTSIKGEHAYELLRYMHECTIITVLYHEYMLITVLNTYQCTIVTVNIDCGCRCWCRSSHRDPERFLRGIEEHVVRWLKLWSYIARV